MTSYPGLQPGDRVALVSTSDPYTRLEPGTEGIVDLVDSMGTAHVTWTTGAKLGMVPGEDQIRIVSRAAARAFGE